LPQLARTGLADRALRDAACAALLQHLDDLSPSELSDAAFSLARGLGHDHALLAAVVERAARDTTAFPSQSLSKILWACARLSYAHDELPRLLERVVDACCGTPDSAQAVSELAATAGAMDWADDRLHDAVAQYARAHPTVFDGHGLAKLMSGLVGVGYDDPPLLERLAEQAAERAAKGELAPSDAARVVWALGEGGVWSAPMMHALSRHMLEVAPVPGGRVAAVSGGGGGGAAGGGGAGSGGKAAATIGGLDAFSAVELQTIVRAANKLNYCSPGIAAAAARLTDRLLPCLEPLSADDDGRTPGPPPPPQQNETASPGASSDATKHLHHRSWTPMSSPPPPPHHHA
jgi:hypothetical protein